MESERNPSHAYSEGVCSHMSQGNSHQSSLACQPPCLAHGKTSATDLPTRTARSRITVARRPATLPAPADKSDATLCTSPRRPRLCSNPPGRRPSRRTAETLPFTRPPRQRRGPRTPPSAEGSQPPRAGEASHPETPDPRVAVELNALQCDGRGLVSEASRQPA